VTTPAGPYIVWAGALLLDAMAAGASYVGAEKCKLCHRAVYESWARTAHARASESTAPAEERCLSCHATRGRELPGVSCESCHGPGSDYSAPEVMIDPEKAEMAGLIRLSIEVCERCHENDEPDHRRGFAMPERDAWSAAIHDVKPRD
jgi:hypothetical protein